MPKDTALSDTKHTKKSVKITQDQTSDLAGQADLTIVQDWLKFLSAQHYSQHTLKAYYRTLSRLAIFLSQYHLTWAQFDKDSLAKFVAMRIEEEQISINSMQLALSVIRKFYIWLIDNDLAKINPAVGYRLKRNSRVLPKIADIDLITQLLDQSAPEDEENKRLWIRDKAMFELLYGSGLRVAELVALNLEDIDLDSKIMRVLGKGKKVRILPMGEKAKKAIMDYLPHRYLWQEQADNALFISERLGTRLSIRSVQKRLKVNAKRAGIDQNLYPHLLRHCFASHLLSESGNLRAVQELLGHQNIGTTQIYTQVDFAYLTQVYDKAHPRAMIKNKA